MPFIKYVVRTYLMYLGVFFGILSETGDFLGGNL